MSNTHTVMKSLLRSRPVSNAEGELYIPVRNGSYGDALFNFVQSLLKISDVTYLRRERIKSTFWEDFRHLLEESVPEDRREFNYNDPMHDPENNYQVDCLVNGMPRPLFVFAIPNDNRCHDVTNTLHQFERWEVPFQSAAVFEDQQTISGPVLDRFSDVAGKQFSSID